MTKKLISVISSPILKHFQSKSKMFSLFREFDTGPEEWFRIEILKVIQNLNDIHILATNQRYGEIPGRPDFVLRHDDSDKVVVELKVLPKDRNYKTGSQRFCAGKNNKADFDALSNNEVAVVIYIHWPDPNDFDATKKYLEKRYPLVSCHNTGIVEFKDKGATISFWVKKM